MEMSVIFKHSRLGGVSTLVAHLSHTSVRHEHLRLYPSLMAGAQPVLCSGDRERRLGLLRSHFVPPWCRSVAGSLRSALLGLPVSCG